MGPPSCGPMRGTQIRGGIPDGANGSGEPLPRPLLRPSPSANLVGNWKGDPLGPQVAAPSGLPNRKQRCAFAQHCSGDLLIVVALWRPRWSPTVATAQHIGDWCYETNISVPPRRPCRLRAGNVVAELPPTASS